jgi:uncharacterized membrane protein
VSDPWLVALVSLHVLGAALWIGGQLVLAPATRVLRDDRDRLRAVARAAQPTLWSGLALAAATGVLLVARRGLAWSGLPTAKAALVVLAAAGAALHVVAGRRRWAPGLVGAGAGVALAAGLALVVLGAMLRLGGAPSAP